jgi:3-hydroxybutyryl-CoA dehydrogenase
VSDRARLAVIGAGTMGAGIAQVGLSTGHGVTLHDADDAAARAGAERIAGGLAREAAKDRLGGRDPADLLRGLTIATGDLDAALADADVVIEAIVEDADAKASAWRALGAAAAPHALLASNTSSLSITALARASGRPERFVGLHFFNPVPRLALVEVVRPDGGPDATVEEAVRFAEGLGKTPVTCADRPGFLVNRLLVPYLNEAATLYDEAAATPEAIDDAMRLGAAMPMGPLALCDLIGIDVVLAIMETLHDEFGDPRYRPAQVLRRLVRAGRLGRKSGAGFHDYGGEA